MNIASMIEVFRMKEIDKKTRANLIVTLGNAINNESGANITEPLVVELVYLLDPDNEIFAEEHYQRYITTRIQKDESA